MTWTLPPNASGAEASSYSAPARFSPQVCVCAQNSFFSSPAAPFGCFLFSPLGNCRNSVGVGRWRRADQLKRSGTCDDGRRDNFRGRTLVPGVAMQ